MESAGGWSGDGDGFSYGEYMKSRSVGPGADRRNLAALIANAALVDASAAPSASTSSSDGERMKLALSMTVDRLTAADRPQWEALYRGYIDFYERLEPQTFYDQAWARLLADEEVHGLVARDVEDASRLVGLVHFIPHPSMKGDVCYLQDLFTLKSARGQGVGTALIREVVAWCKTRGGISRVYWNTHESNPARKLYDAVGTHKGFVKYEISVP